MGVVNRTEPKPTAEKEDPIAMKAWEDKDNEAFEIISSTIKDDQIGHIQACTSAKDAWNKLSAVHERIGQTGMAILCQRLISTKLEEGGSLQTHLNHFKSIAEQMKTLGTDISDEELITWLFISLPKSYGLMVMTFRLQDPKILTFDFVSLNLIQEEAQRKAEDQDNQGTTEVETVLSTTWGKGKNNSKKGSYGKNGG